MITDEQRDAAEQEIREKQKIIDYDTREYPIEVIVEKYLYGLEDDTNELYIPDYQRELVWSDEHQSKFIESIFLGLPIPQIVVADLRPIAGEDLGRVEIVDGVQRVRTLCRFVQDELELHHLTILTHLNGLKFSDLPLARQRRFNRSTIRMITLTDKTDEWVRRDLFERINTGVLPLNSMERRRSLYAGQFLNLVEELARDPGFVGICPFSEVSRLKREPEEFVLRFFAYFDNYEERYRDFRGNVTDFLDMYLDYRNRSDLDREHYRNQFLSMLRFVERYFSHGFSRVKGHVKTPRIRFEAISVGVALALQEKPDLVPKSMDWLESEQFKRYTAAGYSNSRDKVIQRIEYVRDNLLK